MRRRGASLCTMTKAAVLGHGHLRASRGCRSRCERACPAVAPAMTRGSSRPTWAPALRSASWQSRARASGSASCPSASRSGHREGGARGQAGTDGDGAGDPGRAAARRRLQPEESGRQGSLGGDRRGVAQHDLDGPTGELVRVDPDEEAARLGREGDLGGQLNGHGQREAGVVVGVVADDGHSSGGAGGWHAPQLGAGRGRLDHRGRRGSRSCDG